MRAVCWHGTQDVRVEHVRDPEIINPRDAIIRVTSTAICGSDLHLYNGRIPAMKKHDILGHEFMGEVVELGKAVTNLKIGDRVVVPFTISCGSCYFCLVVIQEARRSTSECPMLIPVGLFAIASAKLLGAEKVIAIDQVPERLALARAQGAETIDFSDCSGFHDLIDQVKAMSGGRGPDACIEAVGMEAHGVGVEHLYDRTKQALFLENDRPAALRQALMACRKGGVVSVPGVYSGFADKVPLGAMMNKALRIRTGQTHVHRYLKPLLQHIEEGNIDPSFVISHRYGLNDAAEAYAMFESKVHGCTKVVMKPDLDNK